MATDYTQMWTDLGIALKHHDVLLDALSSIYEEIYLSQKDRPEGMGFFDFVVGDIHGIRVQELRHHAMNDGKVVATYFETDPPRVRLERSGQIVVIFRAPAASGAKYEGRHVTFWTKGSTARIKWGFGAEEVDCQLRESEQ